MTTKNAQVMARLQNCLLCYGESTNGKSLVGNEFFGASGQLAQQIATIFVVRKILNFPKSSCEKLLKDLGNPSSWRIGYCSRCTNIIQEAQFISERLEDLRQKLASIAMKIKSKLYQCYKTKEKFRGASQVGGWEAVDEIRFQFSKEFYKSLRSKAPQRVMETENDVVNDSKSERKKSSTEEELLGSLNYSVTNEEENEQPINENLSHCGSDGKESLPLSPLICDDGANLYGKTNSPEWQPSDDGASSDPDYKPTKSIPVRKSKRRISGKEDGNEKAMTKVSTDIIVKVEHSDSAVEDTFEETGNTVEFDAVIEGQTNILDPVLEILEKGNFRCTICGFKLTSALSRDAHEKRVHMGIIQAFQCDVCHKSFKKKCDLKAHKKLHTPGSSLFLCPKCKRRFPSKISRNAHLQKFHYGVKKPYACIQCGQKFGKPASLELHLKTKHNIVLTVPLVDVKRKELYRQKIESGWKKTKKPVMPNLEKKFVCTEENCTMRFEKEISRDAHIKRFHNGVKYPYDCSLCPKKYRSLAELSSHKCHAESETDHMQKLISTSDSNNSRQVTFPCKECGKTFKNKTCFKVHLRSRAHQKGVKPFLCELCSQTFQTQRYLDGHQKLKHYKELNLTPYQCPECGKKLGCEKNLNWHIKSIHKKEFNFTCDVCPMGFEYEKTKVAHMRIHTGERPFVCSVCSKTFAQSWHLTTHMRIHTGEKPYKCRECDKLFSDKPTFNRHVERHKGILHECSLCSKKYPTRHSFRVHMKMHDKRGEKVVSNLRSSRSLPVMTSSTSQEIIVSKERCDAYKSSVDIVNELHSVSDQPEPLLRVEPPGMSVNEFRDMPRLFAADVLNENNY